MTANHPPSNDTGGLLAALLSVIGLVVFIAFLVWISSILSPS